MIKFKIRPLQFHLWTYQDQSFRLLLSSILILSSTIINSPLEQKWITSLQLVNYSPRPKPDFKSLNVTHGLYLTIGFCQKNKPPIYEINFLSKPTSEWTPIKMSNYSLDVLGVFLCYKTEESQSNEPLSDIDFIGVDRKSRLGENKEVVNLPQGYKLLSHQLPYGHLMYRKVKNKIEQTFRPILYEKYPTNVKGINLSELGVFCFPQGIKLSKDIIGFYHFNFVFTSETRERLYVNTLVFKEPMSKGNKNKLGLKSEQNIFYEKALCLISTFFYTDFFNDCLQRLYRVSMSKNNLPFWKVVENFVSSLIYPTEVGRFGLIYEYGGPKIVFNTNQSYPFVSERSLYTIFKFLTVEHIINVFEAILLEKTIIFVSQSRTVLGYAFEAFTSFIFPFQWEQILIPILPPSLKDYLNSPVPLIAGISPLLIESSIESESIIVYLDNNEVLNDEDLPPLPEKLAKQLRKKLEKLEVYDESEVKEYLESPESTYLFKMQEFQDPHFRGNEVRDIFFEFILTLMRNYKKFWINKEPSKNESLRELFKVEDFLSDLGMTKLGSFGCKFTQSTIFASFIEKRNKNPNSAEVKFFDACIEKRKAKKENYFILDVTNEQYTTIAGPQTQQDKIYHYDKFPSLTEKHQPEEEVMSETTQTKEQNIIQIIEEQHFINSTFYESSCEEFEDPVHKLIHDILLNENKKLFPNSHRSQSFILNWFMETYTNQVVFINELLSNWPDFSSSASFRTISKKEYFVMQAKAEENQIIGVCENGDYCTLISSTDKLVFGNEQPPMYRKSETIMVCCLSTRIKSFLNEIIPKQSELLMEYCGFMLEAELKKSSFMMRSCLVWNMETVLDFYKWGKKERCDSLTTIENQS